MDARLQAALRELVEIGNEHIRVLNVFRGLCAFDKDGNGPISVADADEPVTFRIGCYTILSRAWCDAIDEVQRLAPDAVLPFPDPAPPKPVEMADGKPTPPFLHVHATTVRDESTVPQCGHSSPTPMMTIDPKRVTCPYCKAGKREPKGASK
jgi:hypothetical protein